MAQQLNFFGAWETVVAAPDLPPPPVVVPVVAPVDPRQAVLFEGPHSCRREAELACEALDGEALRAAWRRAQALYPAWEGAQRWPTWADGLDELRGGEGALAQVERALLLLSPARAAQRFPEMSGARLHQVRGSALCRAARRLQDEQGAAARLPDGRPLGFLYLLAGRPTEAALSLRLHDHARPGQGQVLGYLGEALWRCGEERGAVLSYRDAYLHEPAAVDERELTCRPVMDLLDACGDLGLEDGAWLPVVADLQGRLPLAAESTPAPAGASAARLAAALLFVYRQGQRSGQSDAARIGQKRSLLALAPALRELIRRL